MSLFANIDHLNAANGIEAVIVESNTNPRIFRGSEPWKPVLEGSLTLFTRTGEPSVRLVIGKHTVVVQRENEETVAVVLPTGHAIAKSLRRMIRRMSKKDRGPLPEPPEPIVSAPPPSAADSHSSSPFTL
jgi:hypothetical protein